MRCARSLTRLPRTDNSTVVSSCAIARGQLSPALTTPIVFNVSLSKSLNSAFASHVASGATTFATIVSAVSPSPCSLTGSMPAPACTPHSQFVLCSIAAGLVHPGQIVLHILANHGVDLVTPPNAMLPSQYSVQFAPVVPAVTIALAPTQRAVTNVPTIT